MRRIVGLVLALAAAWTAVLGMPATASAHPLGNFTTNHYLGVVVSPEATHVDLVVDFAEIPTIEILREVDTDADGSLSSSEADAARRALCAERLGGVVVSLDGAPLALELSTAGVTRGEGVGGLATLRLVCGLVGEGIGDAAPGTLAIRDDGDAETVGWREIVVRGSGLTIDPADAGRDVASRLTDYPTELLDRPLDERSASVRVLPGGPRLPAAAVPDATPLTDDPSTEAGAGEAPGGVAAEIPGLPDLANLGIGSALIGLLVAAVAGAGHALSPGHGKTVMAAYLVGSRGRTRDALFLGAAVTISHTAGVVLLAAVVLLASDVLPADRIYPIVGAASGVAVTVIGAWLLYGCIRRHRAGRAQRLAHEQGHTHEHGHAHDHDHGHAHGPDAADGLPGLRGLLALGVAGGLVPSTAALLLLLAAVAAGQPAYGLAMAVAFGGGMAVTLSGIGLAVVRGRELVATRLASRLPRLPLTTAAPWAMAVVVLVGGMLLTGQALVTRL